MIQPASSPQTLIFEAEDLDVAPEPDWRLRFENKNPVMASIVNPPNVEQRIGLSTGSRLWTKASIGFTELTGSRCPVHAEDCLRCIPDRARRQSMLCWPMVCVPNVLVMTRLPLNAVVVETHDRSVVAYARVGFEDVD